MIRRLALVRHLYDLGCEQSKQPEPLCAISILTLHDAVELFLEAAGRHLSIKTTSNIQFSAYWGKLGPKLPDGVLPLQNSMNHLNVARRQFKHDGIPPARDEIERIRGTVTSFFEESTPLIFGVSFGSVSMLDLVNDIEVKACLMRGEERMDENDMEGAMQEFALAYHHVWGKLSSKPTDFLRQMENHGPAFSLLANVMLNIAHRVDELTFGIDRVRHARFQSLVPSVTVSPDGTSQFQWLAPKPKPTPEACRFCMNHVVETAIQIQRLSTRVETVYGE